MPLLKKYNLDNQKQIIVWKVEEDFSDYQSIPEIINVKHSSRKNEIMAVRYILENHFNQLGLSYDSQGKPMLNDSNKFISISHSNSVVVLGVYDKDVGLDIELIANKAVKISRKFIHVDDFDTLNSMNEDFHKTLIWAAKESIFKKYSQKEHLIFKQQITIESINESCNQLNATIIFNNGTKVYERLSYHTIEDFILVHSL